MKTLFILGFALLIISANAQESPLLNGFKESYTYQNNAEYTKAIDAIKKVYDENSYEVNIRLAWLHYMAGLFTESVAYYQKSILIMPYSIEARLGIVYPMSALGNWDQVSKQYEKILELDPANVTANYNQGLILYGKAQYDKAITYFQKNVNFYPFTYDSLIMLAWCNFQLGNSREAKVLFNKALLYNPTDTSALEGLSLIK